MIKNNIFNCYIIGDDNITLQCADIILANNHQLLGMISTSERIKEWCITNSIQYIENLHQFQNKYHRKPFDFLFSIVNNEILTKEILELPRYYAINYHNAPLPKYAGLYATSWAILNGEKQHGISWHRMEKTIDAGDILKQPSFSIDDSDTALSLNLKCYEQAIHSFRELVNELATNAATPLKQELSCRSYYGLKDKPRNFGFISWSMSAQEIDQLCRALTLGNYTNQLTVPKLFIHGEIFIVKSYRKLDILSTLSPGKIVSASNNSFQVATKTSDVAILELTDLTGKKLSIENVINLFQLTPGSQLDEIKGEFIAELLKHPTTHPKVEEFWVNRFMYHAPEETTFLSKLEKMETSSYEVGTKTKIPPNIFGKLKKLSGINQHPEDTLLTAALIYLYRLNNYKNLSVELSSPKSRTNIFEFEKLLSDFLPLVSSFNNAMTFGEALQIITDQKNQLVQNYTFSKDIFIRYPQLKNALCKIDISITITDSKKLNLHHNKLNLYIAEDGSWFNFDHQINLKSRSRSYAYFKNMNKQFLTLLDDIVNHPSKKIFELEILDKKDKNNLLINWNGTPYKYNYKKLLHQYFEEQAIKTPQFIAVVFENQTITYDELNKKANEIGNYLKRYGIKKNDLVGILLERSIEMVVCILAVLKSGGAYLPLDPNYPNDRIAYMLNNSQASILILESGCKNHQPEGYVGKTVEINSILNAKCHDNKNPKTTTQHSDLAYVIYTSGTTGKPKGVPISHRAICNHMLWMQNEYSFKANDVFLQKTPFSFDASVWEFFAPLFIGAKLIMASKDTHASPTQLIHLITKNQVSVLQLVPTMLKELLSTKTFGSCTSLRQVFSGGEVLSPELIKAFFKNNTSNAKLHNLYGPTETTIEVITATCTKKDTKSSASIIGKPIMNTKIYVLDAEMQLVPSGITGELYIAGDCLAKGYLYNTEFTKQKFIPNPFGINKKDKLYKTGDLVKWQSDGNIEYLGRSDNQLKIRGFRVELNEIEFNLMKIRGIRQCVVVAEPNLDDSMSLSAYLVLKKYSKISAKDIRIALKKNIPEYMLPTRFFAVDNLRITPSGKIDRKILPTPYKQLASGKTCVAPTNDIEKLLKNIWCSTLKTKAIGVYDDFFELGGNSLSAMKIIVLIQDQFSLRLSLRTLFKFTTINTLAKEIENVRHATDNYLGNYNLPDNLIVPLKTTGIKTPLFLVHPVGGSVFWYQLLEKYLDENRPLYGIQDPGLDKNELVFENLEEMASTYIDAIQKIQPRGPYLIGGASFGSTVAIEIAQQLQKKGEAIAAIISLDGWAFYPTLQNDEVYFQNIMKEQNSRILKKYVANNIYNSEFLLKLQSHREKLLVQYKLPIIKHKLVLFKAKELNEMFKYNAPLNWWEDYSDQPIEFHLVPGDHESMFYEPHIKTLASKLNDSLNEKDIASPNLDNLIEC